MKTWKILLACIAGLFVGWTVQAQMEPQDPDVVELLEKFNCRYEIVDIPDDGPEILLNQCTGESWWYDRGSESTDGYRRGRPRAWLPLPKETPAD